MNAPKRGAILIAGALALAALAAPTSFARPQSTMEAFKAAERSGKLSTRLTPFAYFEEGDCFLAVDTRAAQYAKDADMVPISIGVANRTGTPIRVDLQGFYLEADDGSRYSVVRGESFARNYKRSRADMRLKDSFLEALQSRFDRNAFRAWTPFPAAGTAETAESSIELGGAYWTQATLYFPMPADGVSGKKLSLVMSPNTATSPTW